MNGTSQSDEDTGRDTEVDRASVIDAIRECIGKFQLDLDGQVVATGAGFGSEAIAATAAALAGARSVFALAVERKKHARSPATSWDALDLATHAGRSARLEIMRRIHPHQWNHVDILVSCPRTRPISRSTVEYLRPNSVVALMAEPWELSPEIVDLNACSEMQIKVAAPNLEHPTINLLPDLARLCCRLLRDAGINAANARIAVLCDTPCGRYIRDALIEQGARVTVYAHAQMLLPEMWDAVVVALRPAAKPSMDINGLARVSEAAHGSLLIQFSGEIDRLAARYFGLRVWPPRKPPRGQLGVSSEILGWYPTIRRLVGGLKAAEMARRGADLRRDGIGWIIGPSPSWATQR
ncbi:hypothetical protein EN828_11850 [Mesorhizobium sp. M2D.F.Ca.ET.185.01.1.1]|uniref:hypothetical protein n=1 Tax=unclassified Mesorhizobium TaxID=325217 RepID=UPI000FCBB1A8|nr:MULTISPECIES: hypothetical protein [unclassified Mesorhizobium]TGP52764.1 hypothetical protein EN873_16030 [bacterium M00.F.Ca.ET.230.01.1.1]TGP80966.1 hypothetical protein EN870_10630 [bacterium M00.F.Ca.ET.227.01.1.1]TGP90749.1 hypothetical protein EN864_18500 [bacterium M00.F.Ca.ET.221.01.1.1]TGP97428.1 hypothetical protein EN865_12270 [bacterium M00.F.Ca.ET.222.01.1.1]TGT75960.1 hypothetical protein EN802_06960 [bacterium M00.F.Ca.ET.159.01.1.1]TGT85021.1 hypothetical protein EN800_136